MMLYLDTSALVKLYVDEAEAVATSLLPMLKPGRRGSLLTRIVASSMRSKRIGPAI